MRFVLDLLREASAALLGRASRSALTALGIALGVAALTAMIGMTASSAASISSEFDARKATRIDVTGIETVRDFNELVGSRGLARAAELRGARWAGASFGVGEEPLGVRTRPARSANVPDDVQADAIAVTGGQLQAEQARLVTGRWFDAGSETRGDSVVLVGELLAERLSLRANGTETLWVDNVPLLVVGVISSPDLTSAVPLSVVVPLRTATRNGWAARLQPPIIVVRTDLGAADVVGKQVSVALDPTQQGNLQPAIPPSPSRLENAIESQTRSQLVVLAAVSIVVGAIGVSNTTLVGVLERRHEIGVRRAVGASRSAIVVQFLFESAALGFTGGSAGSIAGLIVALVAATVNDWVPVVPGSLVFLGPVLGLGVGVLAGIYPASRASRIEPVAALS